MRFIIFTVAIGLLIIYVINAFSNRRKKNIYINAGKKWDNIVEELRKRK